MFTNLHMLACFVNLLSIKHYLVQFWDKLEASTVNIKYMGSRKLLESQNDNKIQPTFAIF